VAIQRVSTFRRDRARSFRGWVRYRFEGSVPDRSAGEPGSKGEPRGQIEILREFTGSLDKAERAIFTLYLSDMTYGQMAEVTGMTEDALRVRVSRIKRQFEERYIGG
jgi:DNA-directed RNA polymerase specialized sigma24 family protein